MGFDKLKDRDGDRTRMGLFASVLLTFLALVLEATPFAFAVQPPVSGAAQGSGAPPERLNMHAVVQSDVVQSKVPELGLTDVLINGKTGLALEGLSEQEIDELRRQGEVFLKYRKNELSTQERLSLFTRCLAQPDVSVFCQFLAKNWKEHFKENLGEGRRLANQRRLSYREIRSAIKKAELPKIDDEPLRRIQGALRRLKQWESVEGSVKAALERFTCPSQDVLTALASKTEEFFPGKDKIAYATRLYEKAISCSNEEDLAVTYAKYRVSLLHVWSGNCKAAEKHLGDLSEQDRGKFVSRSYYWRARCAQQSGDKLEFAVMQNKLLKANPLGYHALSINSGTASQLFSLIAAEEPKVQLRSRQRPDLNVLIRLTEILLPLKADRLIHEFVRYLRENMDDLEPEFKLYLAVLANRSNYTLGQFYLLASVFEERPALISRETLKMFYPLREFKTLLRYRTKVDPYLVLALIRQESAFNEHAVSSAGAVGLMQLMPATARRHLRVSRRQLLSAGINIRAGIRHFDSLLSKFDGDVELALAAYNAGSMNVQNWLERYPTEDRMLFLDLIPFSETRNYVALIGRNYYWYLNLYAGSASHVPVKVQRQLAATRSRLVMSAFKSL